MKTCFIYIIIAFLPLNIHGQSNYETMYSDSFILEGLQSNLLLYNINKQDIRDVSSMARFFLPERGMDLYFSEIIENLDLINGKFPIKDYSLRAYYWNPNLPKFERVKDGRIIFSTQTHSQSKGNYNYLVACNFENKDLIFISGDLYKTKIWKYFCDKGLSDSNVINFLTFKSFGYEIKSFKLKKRTKRYIYITAELLNGDYKEVVFDVREPDEINFDQIPSRRLR